MNRIIPETARARLETKRAALSLTRVDEAGVFEGYASLFGIVDLGRDRVERGAFRETLLNRALREIKLLWQHERQTPIGAWLSVVEDECGLKVRGKLNLAVAKAREVLALMREGAVDGLSIGFKVRKSRKDPRTGVRTLSQIDLQEISIVTFPMLPQARVARVKSRADATTWRRDMMRLRCTAAAVQVVSLLGPPS